MGRANKGERDQMMVYPPSVVADAIRERALELDTMPTGEYIASVLAERFGHPYWAAPEVRMFDGGLTAMLESHSLPQCVVSDVPEDAWSDRVTFVTKPVKALGAIVRDYAKREARTLTSVITEELAAFHGIDLGNRVILGEVGAMHTETIQDFNLKREVQQLMA